MLIYTTFTQKYTFADNTFPPYTPFPFLHTFWIYTLSQFYTPFEYIYTPFHATQLLNIHTFPYFTHLLNIHTFLCYTPFEYTHLSQFYTPFEYTQHSTELQYIACQHFFMWHIKSIKSISVFLGVQPCLRAYGVHIYKSVREPKDF